THPEKVEGAGPSEGDPAPSGRLSPQPAFDAGKCGTDRRSGGAKAATEFAPVRSPAPPRGSIPRARMLDNVEGCGDDLGCVVRRIRGGPPIGEAVAALGTGRRRRLQ